MLVFLHLYTLWNWYSSIGFAVEATWFIAVSKKKLNDNLAGQHKKDTYQYGLNSSFLKPLNSAINHDFMQFCRFQRIPRQCESRFILFQLSEMILWEFTKKPLKRMAYNEFWLFSKDKSSINRAKFIYLWRIYKKLRFH